MMIVVLLEIYGIVLLFIQQYYFFYLEICTTICYLLLKDIEIL